MKCENNCSICVNWKSCYASCYSNSVLKYKWPSEIKAFIRQQTYNKINDWLLIESYH